MKYCGRRLPSDVYFFISDIVDAWKIYFLDDRVLSLGMHYVVKNNNM